MKLESELVVGAVGKGEIPSLSRDFQAERESPAFGLFLEAAFSTAFLPTHSATEPKIDTYPNFRPVTSHQLGCLKTSLVFLRPRECDKSLCWVVPTSCCERSF